MSYLHEWHMQRHAFWVPASWGLEEWPKEQISLNLNNKVNFKDFKENFVCLLKMKHIKHIRFDFIRSPGSCPRVEIWGIPWGVGGQKMSFSENQRYMVRELLT